MKGYLAINSGEYVYINSLLALIAGFWMLHRAVKIVFDSNEIQV